MSPLQKKSPVFPTLPKKDGQNKQHPPQKEPRKFHSRTSQTKKPIIQNSKNFSKKCKPQSHPPILGNAQKMIGKKAIVQKNRKGFAFLIFEDKRTPDLFLPIFQARNFFQGDRVQVFLNSTGKIQKVHLLEHRFREIVGRFDYSVKKNQKKTWVFYEKLQEKIEIPNAFRSAENRHFSSLQRGDWIRVKLHFHRSGPVLVTGEILAHYGLILPASVDVEMISAEFNLQETHSPAALEEAQKFNTFEKSSEDLKNREDLRHFDWITIDGETARDFDDAIYVEKTQMGYDLWVAIADVSYYVKDNSALNLDAYTKGTSVYFPERAFHMLPSALSENLCSLKPHEPRLALAVRMKFDSNGKKGEISIFEAIIESKRRATYQEMDREWKQFEKTPHWKYWHYFQLYQAMRQIRMQRGALDFELPEAEILVDTTPETYGEVLSIQNRSRLDSHRLIEEFMIATNEAVTEWMQAKNGPFIYRVHEKPSLQSFAHFVELAEMVGIKIPESTYQEEGVSPGALSRLLRQLEGHPAALLLNRTLLRSMKQAVYRAQYGIHYGLASKAYTHFTSPIRRYPDLIVHRLIRQVLRNPHPLPKEDRAQLELKLTEICEHCSYRERLSAEAERESIKLKQVRLISKKLGEEFDGQVVGMVPTGMFIQLENPFVEGMVPSESMEGDVYTFHVQEMIFQGQRTKRILKIGDWIRIQVVRADLEKRQIDFLWKSHSESNIRPLLPARQT